MDADGDRGGKREFLTAKYAKYANGRKPGVDRMTECPESKAKRRLNHRPFLFLKSKAQSYPLITRMNTNLFLHFPHSFDSWISWAKLPVLFLLLAFISAFCFPNFCFFLSHCPAAR